MDEKNTPKLKWTIQIHLRQQRKKKVLPYSSICWWYRQRVYSIWVGLLCSFVFLTFYLTNCLWREKVCVVSQRLCWFRFSAFYPIQFFMRPCCYCCFFCSNRFVSIPLCEIKWNSSCWKFFSFFFIFSMCLIFLFWWSICSLALI